MAGTTADEITERKVWVIPISGRNADATPNQNLLNALENFDSHERFEIARQERIQISDRTKAGLRRVKREGTRSGNPIGRPSAQVDMEKVAKRRAKGESFRSIASDLGVSAALLCKRAAELTA
jgi:DNA invertase Pin-like site-specific DNA recombinase